MSCSVCLSKFKAKVTLSCTHEFCRECIVKWFPKPCPYCRRTITAEDNQKYYLGFKDHGKFDVWYVKEGSNYLRFMPHLERGMNMAYNISADSFWFWKPEVFGPVFTEINFKLCSMNNKYSNKIIVKETFINIK